MFANTVLTTFRNLARHRLYTLINIVGLAVGLAAAILILLYVKDELSFDTYLPDSGRVYRFEGAANVPGRPQVRATGAQGPAGDTLLADFPERIEVATRILSAQGTVSRGDTKFDEPVLMADPNLFEVLKFPLLAGDPKTALAGTTAIAISERIARKYFGTDNPLGQTMSILVINQQREYVVSAVIRDVPATSHIDPDIVIMLDAGYFPSRGANFPSFLESWGSLGFLTYLRLAPAVDVGALEANFPQFIDQHLPDRVSKAVNMKPHEFFEYNLVRLRDIHLHGAPVGVLKPRGDVRTLAVFSLIAALILAIASINFINLATARSTLRAREVALRKTLGARRANLIGQFLGETVVLVLIALFLAGVIVELSLDSYNSFISKVVTFDIFGDPATILGLMSLVLVIGLGAGLYPAMLLSSFRPARELRANQSSSVGSRGLRAFLVIAQFAISIVLIVGTLVIYNQTRFANNLDTGFLKDNILVLRGLGGAGQTLSRQTFVERLRRDPDVVDIGLTSVVPGDQPESNSSITLPDAPDPILISTISVGLGFFETIGVKPLAGRLFSKEFGKDAIIAAGSRQPNTEASAIINVSAVKSLGFGTPEEAIGKTFVNGVNIKVMTTVVGVVPDVQFRSARDALRPEFYNLNGNSGSVVVHYRTADLPAFLSRIDALWSDIFPDREIRRLFLDEHLADLYLSEQTRGQMLAAFSILAVLISCLGLFGLASFTAARRTREIGLRKVMGARARDIVGLLLWQFSKPVLIANVIAWPVAWYFADDWLKGFRFHIDLGLGTFILAALVALAIAGLTVAGHALKVARGNPVNALRYE